MGIYSELSGKLITAAAQHFKTVGELNDCVIPYAQALAAHLGVDPSRLVVGQRIDGEFVTLSPFQAKENRNELSFEVLVPLPFGNGQLFEPEISVTFRADKEGLHVAVAEHEERLCGYLAAHPFPELWTVTFVDFEETLRNRVNQLAMQISI